MSPQRGSIERKIAGLATSQHGLVTRAQLLEAGLSRDAVKRRLRNGSLFRELRGVYRVGHRAPSLEACYLAAVFACGDRAVLSGPAAAFVFGLVGGTAPKPEVTTTANRRVAGVVTHRARRLDPLEISAYRGIPITTVPRTLVDLAATLVLEDLARACHEAEVRFRVTPQMIATVLARRPGTPGVATLREIFDGEVRVTLSQLERAFLGVLRSASLPLPRTNRPAHGRYVDCRWPKHRLTVELDSYRFHHSRHAWEQDRRREREARARGDEFRRYTYGDVTEDRDLMLAELRELLPSDPTADPPRGRHAPPMRISNERRSAR